ncbi:hypothetical protein IGS75_01315 [Gluconobacter sphaericus]|uniref:hypothetical protein n=1 Tax=Gluconobacter sphaericus TaxID=574987 RepID=UPI001920F9E7|nr:hypothetical protein [Gluconobacter sphaericus]QQX91309.1 hypothetical protein IGS75_01315 [Gluconobacter sphaericus]
MSATLTRPVSYDQACKDLTPVWEYLKEQRQQANFLHGTRAERALRDERTAEIDRVEKRLNDFVAQVTTD